MDVVLQRKIEDNFMIAYEHNIVIHKKHDDIRSVENV